MSKKCVAVSGAALMTFVLVGTPAVHAQMGEATVRAPAKLPSTDGKSGLRKKFLNLRQQDVGAAAIYTNRFWQARLSSGSSFVYSGDWTQTSTDAVFVAAVQDADGDGLNDLILHYDRGGDDTERWQARRSTGSSFAFSGDWALTTGTPVGVADVNGDGKADVIVSDGGDFRVWLSNGSDFVGGNIWTTTTSLVSVVGFADVNGDGKDDLILQYDSNGSRRWQARLSTGAGFAYSGDWTSTTTGSVTAVGVADVNGDGKADLVLKYDFDGSRRWQARLSTGSAFVYSGDWASTTTGGVVTVGLADVNKDGRADLVLQYDYGSQRRWQARLSNGSSAFAYSGDWSVTTTDGVEAIGLGDVDHDGRADLILQYDQNGSRRWQARRSSGTSFISSGDWASTTTGGVVAVGISDVNGDGKADLILQRDTQ